MATTVSMTTYLWYIALLQIFIHQQQVYAMGIPRVILVLVQQPAPLIGVVGRNTLNLECGASGNPIPVLSWSFNGTKVTMSEKYRIARGNTRLQAFDVTETDSGKYRCHATNKFGSVFGQVNVKIHSSGKFTAGNTVTDPYQTIFATVGKSLAINCPDHSHGYGQRYYWGDLPESTRPLYWSNGEPEKLVYVGHDGTIYFSYVTEEHIERINNMNGISCILYQLQQSRQSKRIRLKKLDSVDDTFAPELTRYMNPETIGVANERIALVCGATGSPKPEITWFKDGVQVTNGSAVLNETSGMTLVGHDMELTFLRVQLEHEGMYKCVATNKDGTDEKEGKLKIHVAPQFSEDLPAVQNVLIGDPFVINCMGEGIPLVTYEWYHNNTILKPSDGYTIENGVVKATVSNFNHSGLYMCVISNYLNTVVSPTYININAFGPDFVTKFPKTTYFFKGYENTLKCSVTGGPKPVISYTFNGDDIKEDNKKFMKENGELKLINATESDGGEYSCIATNIRANIEDTTLVKVVDKTVITKPPSNRTIIEGYAMAQLFCHATYDKSLYVHLTWLKNGQEITFDDRVYMNKRITGLSGQILFFKNLKKSDSAKYTCHVYTRDGSYKVSEDKATGSLSVVSKPEAPTGLQIKGNCSADVMELTWNHAISYGVKVTSYIVEYADSSKTNQWYSLETTVTDESSLVIATDKLPSNIDLIFRVKALANFKGDELVSVESGSSSQGACMTPIIGVPIVNPSNVRSKINGKGTLEITWDILDPIYQKEKVEYIIGYRKKTTPPSAFTNTTVDGGVDSLTVPNPGVKEEYEVFVQAKNENGVGPHPSVVTLVSGEEALPQQVENVQQIGVNSTSVQLKWDDVDTASSYEISWTYTNTRRRRRADTSTNMLTVPTNTADVGLKSSSQVSLTVTAVNTLGKGPASQPIIVKTSKGLPSIPENVKIQIIGDAIQVTWDPPSQGGNDVTKYEIRWYKSNEANPTKQSKSYNSTDRQAFINDRLEPLTYYTVEVVPLSEEGEGEPWVMEGLVVSYPDKPGQSGAPIAMAVNGSIMNVTFVLPDNYVGGMPTTFNVYFEKSGASKRKRRDTMKESSPYPSEETIDIDGLDTTGYTVWTTGENSMGEGQPGPKSSLTLSTPAVIPIAKDSAKPFYEEIWFIILIILIILLILLVILIYVCCNRRGGGKYPVGDKEKDKGGWEGQPLKDYSEIPMEDTNGLVTPTKKEEPIRSVSENSLNKKPPFQGDEDDDADSLDDYCEDTKFNEDGSFIGQYGDDNKKLEGTTLV